MKCDLCKRDTAAEGLLCDTCADAVRRLVVIVSTPTDEKPLAATAQAGAAAHSTSASR